MLNDVIFDRTGGFYIAQRHHRTSLGYLLTIILFFGRLQDRFGEIDAAPAPRSQDATTATNAQQPSESPATTDGSAFTEDQGKASSRNGVMKAGPNGWHEKGVTELDWYATQLRAYIGVSGAYDIEDLLEHWHHRGLYKTVMLT